MGSCCGSLPIPSKTRNPQTERNTRNGTFEQGLDPRS